MIANSNSFVFEYRTDAQSLSVTGVVEFDEAQPGIGYKASWCSYSDAPPWIGHGPTPMDAIFASLDEWRRGGSVSQIVQPS